MKACYPIKEEDRIKYEIRKTSGYGWRTLNGVTSFHRGIDLAPTPAKVSLNIPIVSPIDGTIYIYPDPAKCLMIKGIDGKEYFTAHHDRYVRTTGTVKQGEVIAYMGKSGNATGIHLHFGILNTPGSFLSSTDPELQGLSYFIPTNIEMVTLQKEIAIKTLNTKPMNLRKAPDGLETFGEIVPAQTAFVTKFVASGKEIAQNNRKSSTWYKIIVNGNSGYVNGCWVDELQIDSEELKKENEALKTRVTGLNATLTKAQKDIAAVSTYLSTI